VAQENWPFPAPELLTDRQVTYLSSKLQKLSTRTAFGFDLLLNSVVPVLKPHEGDRRTRAVSQTVHSCASSHRRTACPQSPSLSPLYLLWMSPKPPGFPGPAVSERTHARVPSQQSPTPAPTGYCFIPFFCCPLPGSPLRRAAHSNASPFFQQMRSLWICQHTQAMI